MANATNVIPLCFYQVSHFIFFHFFTLSFPMFYLFIFYLILLWQFGIILFFMFFGYERVFSILQLPKNLFSYSSAYRNSSWNIKNNIIPNCLILLYNTKTVPIFLLCKFFIHFYVYLPLFSNFFILFSLLILFSLFLFICHSPPFLFSCIRLLLYCSCFALIFTCTFNL